MRLKWLIKSASPRTHNNQQFENAIHIWNLNRPMTFFLQKKRKELYVSHGKMENSINERFASIYDKMIAVLSVRSVCLVLSIT